MISSKIYRKTDKHDMYVLIIDMHSSVCCYRTFTTKWNFKAVSILNIAEWNTHSKRANAI